MLGVTKCCGTTLVQKGAVWVREDAGFFSLTTIFTRILVLAFPFIDEDERELDEAIRQDNLLRGIDKKIVRREAISIYLLMSSSQ